MKLLISSLALHPESPLKAASLAEELGADGVEVLCDPPWHPRGWDPKLVRELRSRGVVLSLHAPIAEVNLMSPHPEARRFARAEIARTISLAARTGARSITLHLGYRSTGSPFDPPWEAALESLSALGRMAREAGVELCLENDPRHPRLYLADLPRLLEVARETGVGVTLDVGHAWISHGRGALEHLGELPPLVRVVHVHDNHGEVDEHLPLGAGEIPLREFLVALKGCPVAVLELLSVEAIRESFPALRELVAGL